MTDQENKKVWSRGGKPKLELKKPVSGDGGTGAGSVKQSFSHGRSKTVAVEVKRPRRGEAHAQSTTARQNMVTGPEPGTSVSVSGRGRATSAVIRQLTPEERDTRARALRGAVLDNERREAEHIPGESSAVTGAEAGTDSLRQRELEELRRIQEQEKPGGACTGRPD